MDSIGIGRAGEQLAWQWLEQRGYTLVARNWRCKLGEIDVVVRPPSDQYDTLVFVEVRVRQGAEYGDALDSVNAQKQRKVVRAAMLYQQQEQFWGDIRFDVIALDGSTGAIEHIPNAWTAEGFC